MTVHVEVVVVGTNQPALAAAVESAQSGKRVLVITRMRGPEIRRRIHRARVSAGVSGSKRITVLTGAEVQCIAGIRALEAVLARSLRTGRRVDINATALLTFEDEPETPNQAEEKSDVSCSGC